MIKISSAIFKTFFLSLCIVANTHFAFAQTASILPPGYTQYLDSNGKPLSAGKVYNYIPSTTTPKTTWQDAAETIPNANPVILDAGGRAKILGDGSYRQIVKDRNNVTIWDAVTSSTGSGSSSSTATGDGDLVGTVKPWAGMIAPNQYAFAYGQEISRTTYSTLYTAITSSQSVFCNSGSPILNGLSDTNNFWIGMSVEVSCVAAGFSTVVSKTTSTVTLAANANVTTNVTAIFYPWGRGNGSTTFNLPDLRGVVLAGNNIMGGVSASNLTTAYFGTTDPNSSGALGGSQSKTLIASNIPTTPSTNINSIAVSVTSSDTVVKNPSGSSTAGGTQASGPSAATLTSTGSLNKNSINAINDAGGIATSATIAAIGSGYTNGSQTITVTGGTCTTQPQFTVTISGNVFTGTPALLTAGSCTVAPANPAATSGGGGTGGTLFVSYSAQPISIVQPTRTINYIIKITPDSNSATASGVTSLGGMTGDIACGTYLTCTGNIISVVPPAASLVVDGTIISGGVNRGELYNNNGILGNLASIQYDVRKYAVAPKTPSTVCNGSGDDAATITAAITAANTNVGGTIVFPASACIISSTIDMTNMRNIVLQGQGAGRNLTAAVSSISYSPATGSAFKLDGAVGIIIRGFNFKQSDVSYNGDYFDLRQVSGSLNTNLISITDNYMAATSATMASWIRLGKGGAGSEATLSTRIERNLIQGSIQSINAAADSNNIFIANNFFNTGVGTTSHIGVRGEGWTLLNNTFEPTAALVTNNVIANGATNGLAIIGNTFNDGGTGTLISLTGGVITGVSINGNILQGGDFSINLGSAVGASVNGNYLNSNSVNNLILNSATIVTAQGNWGPGTLVGTLPSASPYLIDRNNGSNLLAASGFSLGIAGSRVGAVEFNNATSGTVTVQPVTGALGTRTISLPAASGTVAVSATAPITLSAAGDIACPTCGGGGGSPGGSNTQVQYNNAGAFGGVAGFTFDGTSKITLGVAGTSVGSIDLKNATSGTISLLPVTGALGTISINVPAASGTLAVSATSPITLSAAGAIACATCVTSSGGGAITGTAPVAVSAGGAVSITGAAGQILAGSSPAFTATPTLGVAGATVGTLSFANLTSGSITLSPVTGALGSVTLSLPAATDTLVGKATTDELTNKTLNASVGKGTWTASGTWTLPAITLGGTVTGGGNSVTGLAALGFSSTGTISAPNISFNDADTGIFGSAGSIIFTQNGVQSQAFSATQFIQYRNGAPNIVVQNTASTPAGTTLGTFVFRGNNTTPATFPFAQLAAVTSNDTAGSEAGYFSMQSTFGGNNVAVTRVTATSTTQGELTPNTNLNSTLGSSTIAWGSVYAHKYSGEGSAPALTSCGTSPAITGTDFSGVVTMGTGSPTGCTITFATAYTSTPNCTVTWQTNIASMQYTLSTTAITLTQTGTSSNKVNYICTGI